MVDEFDVIVRDASIVDGSGRKAFVGSIGVRGEKVAAMGKVAGDARRVIEAKGLTALPGFIDAHSHHDGLLLWYPRRESLFKKYSFIIFFIFLISSNTNNLFLPSVKPNDYAIYNYYGYSYRATHSPWDIPYFQNYYASNSLNMIKVEKVEGESITFQVLIQRNVTYPQKTDNWIPLRNITANFTAIYTDPYKLSVHIYFFPSNRIPNDVVPTIRSDYKIWINDTTTWNFNGVFREINHIKFKSVRNQTLNNGMNRKIVEEEYFFDKNTGLMIKCNLSEIVINYSSNNELYDTCSEVQNYELQETNIWSKPFYQNLKFSDFILVFINILLVIIIIYIKYYKK